MGHIHKLFDYVATAYIVHDNKVLLVHHKRYDLWVPVGGHIELDENPEQALLREVQEETGLDIELLGQKPKIRSSETTFLHMPDHLDVHDANPPHRHISFVYFVRAQTDKHRVTSEHHKSHWFTVDELDDPQYNLTEAVKFYCRQALKKILGYNA